MKISKSQLKQIIQEELSAVLMTEGIFDNLFGDKKTQMAPKPGSLAYNTTVSDHISGLAPDAQEEALGRAFKKGYKPEEGQIGYKAPAATTALPPATTTPAVTTTPKKTWWDKAEETANPITAPLNKAIKGAGKGS
jgi:hypothetical protein|tara:strand:+ start:995 stop:1402 length:408 start_codon:yes stop_codon:yes gene_type:complete